MYLTDNIGICTYLAEIANLNLHVKHSHTPPHHDVNVLCVRHDTVSLPANA